MPFMFKMTPWEALQASERGVNAPAISTAWLESKGYTAETYNALEKWQRTELWSEAKYGKPLDDSLIGNLGEGFTQTMSGYGEAIQNAATKTVQTARTIAVVGVVGVCAVTLIIYREPIKKAMARGKKA